MSSHHNFAFSWMTFGDNPYIPPPNLSIRNDRITQVSSHPSNQMNFQRNSSEDNINSGKLLYIIQLEEKQMICSSLIRNQSNLLSKG